MSRPKNTMFFDEHGNGRDGTALIVLLVVMFLGNWLLSLLGW